MLNYVKDFLRYATKHLKKNEYTGRKRDYKIRVINDYSDHARLTISRKHPKDKTQIQTLNFELETQVDHLSSEILELWGFQITNGKLYTLLYLNKYEWQLDSIIREHQSLIFKMTNHIFVRNILDEIYNEISTIRLMNI